MSSDPAGHEQRLQLRDSILSDPILASVLRYAPMFVGILDAERRFVVAHNSFFEGLGIDDMESLIGLRPGFVFGCIHSRDVPEGCGEGPACRFCGAVQTVLRAQRTGTREHGTSRLTTQKNGTITAWDLEVEAEPIDFKGTPLVLLFMRDISSDLRQQALERTFYHDVLNSVTTLRSAISIVDSDQPSEEGSVASMIPAIADDVAEQIGFQQRLARAERGELALEVSAFSGAEEVEELVRWERWMLENAGIDTEIVYEAEPFTIATDRTLFRRIVLNMIRNAREASGDGDTITISTAAADDRIRVSVHNPAVIPKNVQLQIFQRSFSTRGTGRGLGTYSMKFLSLSYLGGDVTFASTEEAGTEFVLDLPLAVV